ncbi:hypothetical protein EYF80_008561 [Liparis tanakae]|uniref:Uncharacterized protein n=1 Tax=Liparis tanakae TaxID=230148 RepID=A0A4Z2IU03_9TELE|nr:hypothetical protein EYF80_008561 [Liparis tanakae]
MTLFALSRVKGKARVTGQRKEVPGNNRRVRRDAAGHTEILTVLCAEKHGGGSPATQITLTARVNHSDMSLR